MVSQRFFVLAAPAFLLSVVPACNSSGPNEPNRGVTIEKVSGDKISVVFGTGITPTVRVQRDGEPEAGVNVKFSVVSGGGTVANWEVRTDENGVASTLWLLGATTGNQVLRASLAGESAYFTATAAVPQVGTSYFGRNNYVEYIPGELPIILSSPHDGPLTPSEIPDRTWGTTGRDLNTMDLTRRIASALQRLTGKRPYVAINHLRRIKLDPNREIVEAAQGSRYSEFAWHQYHTWIDMARDEITKKYGTGLLLDIHGHSHEIKRVEVGYMLNSSDLNRSDSQLDVTRLRSDTKAPGIDGSRALFASPSRARVTRSHPPTKHPGPPPCRTSISKEYGTIEPKTPAPSPRMLEIRTGPEGWKLSARSAFT